MTEPQRSDRYRVRRELGRGGMGVVTLVHDAVRGHGVTLTPCMTAPLVVVLEAFVVRGGAVQVTPRITVDGAERGPFPVRLHLPDGSDRSAKAALDVAHIKGPHGAFALVRLLGLTPADVPPGTEVWRV